MSDIRIPWQYTRTSVELVGQEPLSKIFWYFLINYAAVTTHAASILCPESLHTLSAYKVSSWNHFPCLNARDKSMGIYELDQIRERCRRE